MGKRAATATALLGVAMLCTPLVARPIDGQTFEAAFYVALCGFAFVGLGMFHLIRAALR